MRRILRGFTLVELIVVITILAILGTIGFLSMQGYSSKSRDAVRISDIKNIEKVFELYRMKFNEFPTPDDAFTVSFSGSELWQQGLVGTGVILDSKYITQVPLDPIAQIPYTYSLAANKQEFQIATMFENPISYTALAPQAGAFGSYSAYIKGNYNGVLLKVSTGTGTSLAVTVPSLISTDSTTLNFSDVVSQHKLVYQGGRNTPASYVGSDRASSGDTSGFESLASYEIVGSQMDVYENRLALLQLVQESYSGSVFAQQNDTIKKIIPMEISLDNSSLDVQIVACGIIQYFMKMSVSCGAVSPIVDLFEELVSLDLSWLPSQTINYILKTSGENIWFATDTGVGIYDLTTGESIVYTTADGLISDTVYAVYQDANGDVWFGTNQGISFYDGNSWTSYTTDDGLLHNHINSIYGSNDGSMWFGTNKGITRYALDTWESYTKKNSDLLHNHIQTMLQDSQGNMWYGSVQGLNKYDGTNWSTYTSKEGLVANDVQVIYEDDAGNIWVGTTGGASVRIGNSWTSYTTLQGLIGNHINGISQDSQGNIWFATNLGLSRFDGSSSWTSYTVLNGLPSNMVYSVYEDASGDIVAITEGGFFVVP